MLGFMRRTLVTSGVRGDGVKRFLAGFRFGRYYPRYRISLFFREYCKKNSDLPLS